MKIEKPCSTEVRCTREIAFPLDKATVVGVRVVGAEVKDGQLVIQIDDVGGRAPYLSRDFTEGMILAYGKDKANLIFDAVHAAADRAQLSLLLF